MSRRPFYPHNGFCFVFVPTFQNCDIMLKAAFLLFFAYYSTITKCEQSNDVGVVSDAWCVGSTVLHEQDFSIIKLPYLAVHSRSCEYIFTECF